jgi:signal transduction histidine kinase
MIFLSFVHNNGVEQSFVPPGELAVSVRDEPAAWATTRGHRQGAQDRPGFGLQGARAGIHLTLQGSMKPWPCCIRSPVSTPLRRLVRFLRELNALKHAFPANNKSDRQIAVRFEVAGSNWKLSVADNGIGAPVGVFAQAKSGLGTSIVNALAQQLDAKVEVLSDANGTAVSVSHATFSKAQ